MGNHRTSYVLLLMFSSLLFWTLYARVVFDELIRSYIEQGIFTTLIHWIIDSFGLTELKIKLCCFVFSLGVFYFSKFYTKKRPELKFYYWLVGVSFFLFLYPFENIINLPFFIRLPICVLSFPLFLFGLFIIKNVRYSRKIDQDQFNLENQSFMQEKEIINTEDSLNFEHEFYFEGKKHVGAINIVEVFRSIWVYGVMGSGKTFSFLMPMIYQLIKKDFTLAVYDFKFPSMSTATYNFYKAIQPEASFFQLCFTDMRYSHKCNAIEPKYIASSDDIKNAAKTVLKNLSSSDKENPFFLGSAIGIYSAILALQKKMQIKYEQEICSVPHSIILGSVKIKYLLPIMLSHKDILLYITSLRDAFDEGAAEEQLAGQTATLQQKLSDLFNKDFMFIASGKSDFSLDLNEKYDKKILTIGGAADKAEAISPFTSLYFEIISKRTNKPGRHKFMKVIDEMAQLYYQGLKSYLETGRENKAGIIAGMQGVSQIFTKTPQKEAEGIIEVQGTIITGMAGKRTAEMVSDRIGKTNQNRSSVADKTGDSTVNHTFYESTLVPPSRIANFSSGDFCGVVTDSYNNKIEQKRFLGTIIADKESSSIGTKHKLPQIHSFKNEKTLGQFKELTSQLSDVGFLSIYEKALLSADFTSFSNDVSFFLKYLKMDADFLQKEYNHIQSRLKKAKKQAARSKSSEPSDFFCLTSYVKDFIHQRLMQVILDNEKELFLDNYIDNLYTEVETWVRAEYLSVTGKEINDDLFNIDNFKSEERDNLYF